MDSMTQWKVEHKNMIISGECLKIRATEVIRLNIVKIGECESLNGWDIFSVFPQMNILNYWQKQPRRPIPIFGIINSIIFPENTSSLM